MKVSVPVRVSIDWHEELVDNDRSNFYMRFTPRATIEKIGTTDGIEKKVGKKILEDLAAGSKNIKVNK